MTVDHMIKQASDLEMYLGDPHEPAGPMNFEQILRMDEHEVYPYELVGLLQRWGLHEYCLPAEHGGQAGDVEVGYNLLRLVARRDPTTATTMMLSLLAVLPVWIGGTREQLQRFVNDLMRGTKMAWGLSERRHGSDVLANETRAERVDGGFLITGEKDLIGNATVADVVLLQARTGERGGPGDWSVFAVRKRACPAGSIVELPNEELHGLRGLDLSGIRLDRVFVPDEDLIGPVGAGLELILKSSQVARTTVTGMALGLVDTALRVTCDFAVGRRIFGQTVAEIPNSRRQLAESFADLLLAEAVCTGAVRGLQANYGQVSIFSSVVKYFVPTLLDQTMSRLSVLLGARLYLRSHPHYGIFQKMLRDLPVANFADGNTQVNLKNIVASLDLLLSTADGGGAGSADARARVAMMFDLDAELPVWEPRRQRLYTRDGDDTVAQLPSSIRALRRLAADQADPHQRIWFDLAADLAERLLGELHRMREQVGRVKRRHDSDRGNAAELFVVAEQYCALHAAAAAVHLVAFSHPVLADPLPDGAVLLTVLHRVWQMFHPTDVIDTAVHDRAVEVLLDLHRERRLFSHWQFEVQASPGSGT